MDSEDDLLSVSAHSHRGRTACRAVLHGVADQAAQRMAEPCLIPIAQLLTAALNFDPVFRVRRQYLVGDVAHDLSQVHLGPCDGNPPSQPPAGEVQQVAHHLHGALGATLNACRELALGLVQYAGFLPHPGLQVTCSQEATPAILSVPYTGRRSAEEPIQRRADARHPGRSSARPRRRDLPQAHHQLEVVTQRWKQKYTI
jgi:hypothetical protein